MCLAEFYSFLDFQLKNYFFKVAFLHFQRAFHLNLPIYTYLSVFIYVFHVLYNIHVSFSVCIHMCVSPPDCKKDYGVFFSVIASTILSIDFFIYSKFSINNYLPYKFMIEWGISLRQNVIRNNFNLMLFNNNY